MDSNNILFDSEGKAVSPDEIGSAIEAFGYSDAVQEIIEWSRRLDEDGKVFIKCATRVLSNFGMTRGGRFKNANELEDILRSCWKKVGKRLLEINVSELKSDYCRDRYLLELSEPKREELIAEIWLITKDLLPFTMGKTSYGLVGASKILFSVLPEIVLPVDNSQWLHLFKTVDLGDVIRRMVYDIQCWESATENELNEMDSRKQLTTLPSVYNVMAMKSRP
jgi:hypothetical protein